MLFNRCPLTLSALALCLSTVVHADKGEQTAADMLAYYHDTRENCGTSPAFICSGIMLRTTRPSPQYHTWNHSPQSREKGGVAFSWLRADTPISRLAEGARSGYTLAPIRHREPGTLAYQVACAYPTDGDSWTRNTYGCGDNSQTPGLEQFCHEQEIKTAEDWIARYNATGGDPSQRYFAQCAFDVSQPRGQDAINEFYESVRVMTLMPNRPFPWNEIILRAWDEAESSQLPIQSFFHIAGQWGGLQNAQFDQRDWHATTGKVVPIIEITLPHWESDARFVYHPHDQAIGGQRP